jgi:hypothetical protein
MPATIERTASEKIEAASKRKEVLIEEIGELESSIESQGGQIEARIKSDASGTAAYPSAQRTKDRGELESTKQRLCEARESVQAVEILLGELSKDLWTEKRDQAFEDQVSARRDALELRPAFEETMRELIRLYGKIRDAHGRFGRANNAFQHIQNTHIPERKISAPEGHFPFRMENLKGFLKDGQAFESWQLLK